MPDDPTQPGQLPPQQFSVSNDSTRSQTRLAKLEDRVKQLEKGKATVVTPMFKWEQATTVTNTTSYKWSIDLPVPQYSGTGVTTTEMFYWFRFNVGAVAGTVTGGTISASIIDTHSWAYTLGSSANANFAPSYGAAPSAITPTSGNADKSSFVAMPIVLTSPLGSFSTLDITITKTAGTATGVTISNGRLYAIIPTTFAS